jgi:hypothetical protein
MRAFTRPIRYQQQCGPFRRYGIPEIEVARLACGARVTRVDLESFTQLSKEVLMSNEKDIQKSQYNYSRFRPDLMVERFEGGPNPGETAPDFTAVALDGNKVQLSEFRGRCHVVLQFGSVT